MEEDYKDNPIYKQGFEDGYNKAMAEIRKALTNVEVNHQAGIGVIAKM